MKINIPVLVVLSLALFACSPKTESPKAELAPQNEIQPENKAAEVQPDAPQNPVQEETAPNEQATKTAGDVFEDPAVEAIEIGSIQTKEAQNLLDSYKFDIKQPLSKQLEKVFHDIEHVSALEAEALLLLLKDSTVPECYEIKEHKTAADVFFILSDKAPTLSEGHQTYTKLMYHSSAAIRGASLRLFEDTICQNPVARKSAAQLLEIETAPFVLSQGYIALSGCMNHYPAVAKRALAAVQDNHPAMRRAAAIGLAKTGKDIPGADRAMVQLLSDSHQDPKQAACHYVGYMQNEDLLPYVTKILSDPNQQSLHYACMNSLMKMWYDYPEHQNTSEAAYIASLEYFKTMPQQLKESSWMVVELPKWINEEKIDQWRERATYFSGENLNEFTQVFSDIAMNESLDYATRMAAITVISRHNHDALTSLHSSLAKLKSKKKDTKRIVSEIMQVK